MIKFYIHPEAEKFRAEIAYTLNLWAKNQSTTIQFTPDADQAVTIGMGEDHTLKILADHFRPSNSDASLSDPNTKLTDIAHPLSLVFYMINAIQEFDSPDHDELKRFKFKNSYQSKFGNAKENLVQRYFDQISKTVRVPLRHEKTSFFLSHDIDLVNGAIIEDGFAVLKQGRFDLFLKMLFNVAMRRPDWLNMDKIMKLESAYDCRSIFFWIVNKGKLNQRESNADYSFRSDQIQRQFTNVGASHFENGIHKSLTQESFMDEFEKYGSQPFANRYHYLKFTVPEAFHDIEAAGLKLDASLGFAEEIGFRNSYGLPFNPYNFRQKKAFQFVEAPLHVMDRTYFQYKRFSPAAAENDIFDFFEKNKMNCVLSILWHNNFFTDYKFKGYLPLYKKILSFIRDSNFSTITASEIVNKYSIA
ncbi:MAG TPA: hypothetical protein VK666_01655 [Chryseolinea sp.]|nr:hypothetical protein [Chryseolinea sp.]